MIRLVIDSIVAASLLVICATGVYNVYEKKSTPPAEPITAPPVYILIDQSLCMKQRTI
jgi:hypothetical protein